FDADLTEPMAHVLGELGSTAAFIVHGYDGLDELTTSGPNRVSHLQAGHVTTYELDAADYGFARGDANALRGGDPAENAVILRAILAGQDDSPRRDVSLLNAAAALTTHTGDFGDALALARQSLDSGAALAKLEALVAASRQA
ncbi:MAG: anthranilate phosphoribosyltransferase, partial [Anaerolineales bacterium]|nr:anthranilate phosphoribosyltransferase [Anaerolineales bacterium]